MTPTESEANPVAEIVNSIHHFIEQRQKMAHTSPDTSISTTSHRICLDFISAKLTSIIIILL
jgi:hypothetical protein